MNDWPLQFQCNTRQRLSSICDHNNVIHAKPLISLEGPVFDLVLLASTRLVRAWSYARIGGVVAESALRIRYHGTITTLQRADSAKATAVEQSSASTAKGGGRAPPYYAYGNFTKFIRDMKVSGVPPKIDRHAMAGIPQTVRAQLITGIRFLDLIDGDDRPTQTLHELAAACDTEQWAPALEKLLRRSYPDVFKLDLMTVTPGHLLEAFEPYAASDEVRRKCFVFFTAAARDADIQMGVRLAKKNGRSSGLPPHRRRVKGMRREAAPPPQVSSPTVTAPTQATTAPLPSDLMGQLVNKFPTFDPSWPDEIKAKWFDGFHQFMGMAKKE
ncbi:MAG: hypothetical protein ACLPT4_17265 [Verrucomicrobiia bacterium]